MKPDTAEALDTLAGEFVLGTLSPEQHAAVTERLRTDLSLRAAVDAWEARLLELTALAAPQPPSARLWGRIQRSLNELAAQQQHPGKWWQRLGLWQGLSAAGLAASVLLAFTLLTAPPPATEFVVVLVAPSSQAPGWVVQTSDSRTIELIPLGKDAVPEGMALQFWTKGEQWGAPVSLGLVNPGEPYRVPLQSLPPLEANQLFELTLERSGGSPTGRPTGPVKFIGRAVKVI
ncbi:RNA polymerase subunit sigma-70 [Pseudomonas sp. LB-090624]|uniref:anti-sigma factor n=1 Tax=Pseudomonas sp. LB-090624 TaxID=2213079 RepID=UPI000D8E05A2|nr:anti-sigma factor [Pseudomonas sp. LB-090624]PYB81006.1 RNA polymerase subunit sigma-70 [Pseudomonas sp. LB-090624]